MSLNHLNSKKQFAILFVLILFFFGLYTKFRMLPAIDNVASLSRQLKVDRNLLKNPNIPEEPVVDIEDLKDDVAELEVELEQLTVQSSALAKKMPELDSQDVMLKISEAARSSRVRIVNNTPFLARKRYQYGASTKQKKELSIVEQRKRERALRKARQKARRKAARSGALTAVGIYTREGELMDKLVNEFEVSRPLHEIKIEGTYANVKTFIEALQGLPWQITVVKIDYSLLGANAAQGYPQPLIVDMIIGA